MTTSTDTITGDLCRYLRAEGFAARHEYRPDRTYAVTLTGDRGHVVTVTHDGGTFTIRTIGVTGAQLGRTRYAGSIAEAAYDAGTLARAIRVDRLR